MSDIETPEFIERFQQGHDEAFAALVRSYQRELFLLAFRILRNESDAEELVQEAFLRAYRSRERFRGDCSLRSWMYQITKNLCFNRYKKRRREDVSDELESNATTAETVLETMENEEKVRLTRAAVEELPERQQLILKLRVYQGLSLQEIADAVESPLGTVKANLFHAIKNLRKKLEPIFPEEVNL